MVDYTTQDLINTMIGKLFTYPQFFALLDEYNATFRIKSAESWGGGACEVFAYTAVDELYEIRIVSTLEWISLYGWFVPNKPISKEDVASRTQREQIQHALHNHTDHAIRTERELRSVFKYI
jgi:hypothetical protein